MICAFGVLRNRSCVAFLRILAHLPMPRVDHHHHHHHRGPGAPALAPDVRESLLSSCAAIPVQRFYRRLKTEDCSLCELVGFLLIFEPSGLLGRCPGGSRVKLTILHISIALIQSGSSLEAVCLWRLLSENNGVMSVNSDKPRLTISMLEFQGLCPSAWRLV
ncbi:hypothetical protein VTO42DRAFT_7292 [Malbranchea cinnamomea]